MKCRKDSKKYCMACQHYDYCDRANRCDGKCYSCDIIDCENNPYMTTVVKSMLVKNKASSEVKHTVE